MHLAKIARIIFLLISHCVATHIPSKDVLPSHLVHDAPIAASIQTLKPRVPSKFDAGYGLAPRQGGNGGSCDRRAKCKKKNIRNPADETKCIRCPPAMKPDPTRTLCIKDNNVSDEDKKKQYEERIKEKVKEKLKERFEKFKETFKERLETKKEEKKKEWEEKNKRRQDKRNQKKYRRMAACSPAVAAAIGTQAMLEMADGGFSEDLFDSINGDMLEFWPNSDIDDQWLDNSLPDDESDITKEDYVKEFLLVGDAASETSKRSIEKRDVNGTVQATFENSKPSTEKRNIFNSIASAFRSLIASLSNMARVIGGTGGRISQATKYFKDGKSPNLKKPGESKFSRAEQKSKAKEISQNKNWRKCLRGEKPER